jgi:hypothetical protein
MFYRGIPTAAAAAAATGLLALTLQSGGGNLPLSPSAEIRALAEPTCEYQRYSIHVYNTYFDPRFRHGCGALTHKGLRIENFFHRGPHGRYRVTYVRREGEAADRFIIYLVGGPRLPTTILPHRPFESEPLVALAARHGTGVLAPEYLGTLTRSFYPGPDVPAAAEEALALIADLRTIYPRANLVVVASSAGSLVALEMLRRRSVPTVLVTPSLDDLQTLVDRVAETDLPADAASQVTHFYRYRPGSEQVEEVTATFLEQLRAFAGDDFQRDLPELFARIPTHRLACLAVVYGSLDRRVRVSRIPEIVARFPTVPVVAVPGMTHGPVDGPQAAALAVTVERVAPRRCR